MPFGIGRKPFRKGVPCTDCDTGHGWCEDGLCIDCPTGNCTCPLEVGSFVSSLNDCQQIVVAIIAMRERVIRTYESSRQNFDIETNFKFMTRV